MSFAVKNCRFVVLHHMGIETPHFDLLIEPTPHASLWTWRLPNWPIGADDHVEHLADHRPTYLTYEGPISGGRGTVQRVFEGRCSIYFDTEHELTIEFESGHFKLPSSRSI